MDRARVFAVSLAVFAASACLPSAATAASFTWDLTSDFTVPPMNSNPDKDSYGARPWSYETTGNARLLSPDANFNGGLSGWRAAANSSPFVAIRPARDKVVLQPTTNAPAVVAWTSPVSGNATVSGSVTADQPAGVLCPNASWFVLHGGTTLAAGTANTSPTSFSKSVAVHAGESIVLSVAVPVLLPVQGPGCTETSATFTITQAAPAPAVTLLSPANGATITGGQPTFSGTADTGFGALGTVTVRVYGGSGTTGIPVRTLPTTVSNGTFSTTAIPLSPTGYTRSRPSRTARPARRGSARSTPSSCRPALPRSPSIPLAPPRSRPRVRRSRVSRPTAGEYASPSIPATRRTPVRSPARAVGPAPTAGSRSASHRCPTAATP